MSHLHVRVFVLFIIHILLVSDCFARTVVSGERLWHMQQLVTEASCDATIAQADFTAGVMTISTGGVYCLAESVVGKIIISANNVALDLNRKQISNTSDDAVVVNGVSDCTIRNGLVSSTSASGIRVASGSRVNIEHISASDCIEGIRLEDTVHAHVDHCDLVSSTTGITISNSSGVQVKNTVASSNSDAGFSLFSSEKNLICDCKAVQTGDGQTGVSQNVYGFVSDDGQGNVFDSCIAQSTLATTVTDSASAVVGFALTGTETNSEISNCKSNIVQTDIQTGYTVPYGIWLQPQFDSLSSVTVAYQGTTGGDDVAWSPDGAYLATAGDSVDTYEIQIFLFDRAAGTLTRTDGANQGTVGNGISWYPDGTYFVTAGATEGADEIQVFSFNKTTGKLTKTDGTSQGTIGYYAAWTPDGAYLATIGTNESGDEIQLFSFDSSDGTITKTDGASQGGIPGGWFLSWSPDGSYLGTTGAAESGHEIQIFSLNRAAGTITKTDGVSQGAFGTGIRWSPDGAYVATCGESEGGDSHEIQIFSFDSSAGTITKTGGASTGSTSSTSIDWSPDGKYLAVSWASDGKSIYTFDPVLGTISLAENVSTPASVNRVAWSPDGAYLADATTTAASGIEVVQALTFPTLNVIKNNIVHAAAGGVSSALGVGICGSSIENFIIGNFAYDNASFNYQFVPNVFDQRFDSTTSDVQNISLKTQSAMYTP